MPTGFKRLRQAVSDDSSDDDVASPSSMMSPRPPRPKRTRTPAPTRNRFIDGEATQRANTLESDDDADSGRNVEFAAGGYNSDDSDLSAGYVTDGDLSDEENNTNRKAYFDRKARGRAELEAMEKGSWESNSIDDNHALLLVPRVNVWRRHDEQHDIEPTGMLHWLVLLAARCLAKTDTAEADIKLVVALASHITLAGIDETMRVPIKRGVIPGDEDLVATVDDLLSKLRDELTRDVFENMPFKLKIPGQPETRTHFNTFVRANDGLPRQLHRLLSLHHTKLVAVVTRLNQLLNAANVDDPLGEKEIGEQQIKDDQPELGALLCHYAKVRNQLVRGGTEVEYTTSNKFVGLTVAYFLTDLFKGQRAFIRFQCRDVISQFGIAPIEPEGVPRDTEVLVANFNKKQRKEEARRFHERLFHSVLRDGVARGKLKFPMVRHRGVTARSLLITIAAAAIKVPKMLHREVKSVLGGDEWVEGTLDVEQFIAARTLHPDIRQLLDTHLRAFMDDVFVDEDDKLLSIFDAFHTKVTAALESGIDLIATLSSYLALRVADDIADDFATKKRMRKFEGRLAREDARRANAAREIAVDATLRKRIRDANGSTWRDDDGRTPSIVTLLDTGAVVSESEDEAEAGLENSITPQRKLVETVRDEANAAAEAEADFEARLAAEEYEDAEQQFAEQCCP
jgi:hypothetical protein